MDELLDVADNEFEELLAENELFQYEQASGASGALDIAYIEEGPDAYAECHPSYHPGYNTLRKYDREEQIDGFLDKCRDFFSEHPGRVLDVKIRSEDAWKSTKRYEAWIIYRKEGDSDG